MLITLIQPQSHTSAPLTIGVSADRADGVISAMARDGWRVLSKQYESALPVLDGFQVALLDVSTLAESVRSTVSKAG